MKPLAYPYVPDGRVSFMLASSDMSQEMIISLTIFVPELISLTALENLPDPVNKHRDMQLVNVAEGVFIHAPKMDRPTVQKMKDLGFIMVAGEKNPSLKYPYDIPYNAAVIGDHVFLNTHFADPVLMDWLLKTGKKPCHVKQGYAKCAVSILNFDAIITSDKGIFNAARAHHKDVLFINPQEKIWIKSYNYGFIGGCTGLISKEEMAFTGDFDKLDDAEIIEKFLTKYGIRPVSLSQGFVHDLGSLIPLCSV